MSLFVWNVSSVERIRAQTESLMNGQADNMTQAANAALALVARNETEIQRLESLFPIMMTVSTTSTVNVTRTVNGQRVTTTEQQTSTSEETNHVAEANTRADIVRLERENIELNASAKKLRDEVERLLDIIYQTNKLIRLLYDKAKDVDNCHAEKMEELKWQIQQNMNIIRELYDRVGATGYAATGENVTIGALLSKPYLFDSAWVDMQSILSRPATQILPEQYAKLSFMFVMMGDDISASERFLNLLAEPVTLPNGVSNPHGANAFTICPQKIAGLQWYMQGAIDMLLFAQMGFATNSAEYEAFQEKRDRIMTSSALLTVINSLTDHGVQLNTNPLGAPRVQQRVLLGEGGLPPIKLTAGTGVLGGVDVSFARGTIGTAVMPGGGSTPTLHISLQPVNTTGMTILDSTINVSKVMCGASINGENIRALGDHFYQSHQFDRGAHIQSGIGQIFTGFLKKPAAGASIGIDLAKVFTSIPKARTEAEKLQGDFRFFEDNALLGLYNFDFQLRGVLVTEGGQPPQIISWETVYTYESLRALNSIAETSFTREDFLRNPEAIIRAHDGIRGNEIGAFNRQAERNRSHRNEEINSQAEIPEQIALPSQTQHPSSSDPTIEEWM